MNIDHEMVENLKQNHQTSWQVVIEDNAMSGLCAGDHYAAIVLSENFNVSFLSVPDSHFEWPKINLASAIRSPRKRSN